jgi:hypothetical protein
MIPSSFPDPFHLLAHDILSPFPFRHVVVVVVVRCRATLYLRPVLYFPFLQLIESARNPHGPLV